MKNYLLIILLLISYLYSEIEFNTNKDFFLVGEHIEANFSGLDSYGSDWIGIFESKASNEDYIYWFFARYLPFICLKYKKKYIKFYYIFLFIFLYK